MLEKTGEPCDAALHAILVVAAKRPNLLAREAFEELADALRAHVTFARMSVLLHEGLEHERLYVHSRGPAPVVPVGARFSVADHPGLHRVLVERAPYVCDDTRLGSELERRIAAAGQLSYISVPIQVGPERRVMAELFLSFDEAHAAGRAPLPLLEAVADIVAAHLGSAMDLARERRLAKILETSGDAMIAWDAAGLVTDANAAAEALVGRSRGALIGARIRDLLVPLPPGNTPAHGERVTLVQGGAGSDGARSIEVSVTVTSVQDDPLVASHALLRDLSVVAAAERAAAQHLAHVRELEEQHRTLLDNAPLIIFRLDPREAELVYLNRHAERLLGVPTAEALRTPGFLREAHATQEGTAAFDAAVARAKVGAVSLPYEARLRCRGGGEVMGRGNVYPLLSERGEVVAIEGVLADVSGEHAARTRLVQADRLSTLGMLAAGMAHEINNPAAFITLGLDMLARVLRSPRVHMDHASATSAGETIAELRESIRRIVEITKNLRVFASPPATGDGTRMIVDVNRTVEAALTLARGEIIERAHIVRELEDVPPVMMDDGRLGQVVVNLLMNAAQAIPKTQRGDHSVTVITRSDGETVEIAVRDTGTGIDEQDRERIWAPFFTTKPPELGTGLGLSISREIVERAGGTIRAVSPVPGQVPPRGTEIVIRLPVAGRPESVPPMSSQPPSTKRGMHVLVVDDEASLARALTEEISEEHVVESVASGAYALERFAERRFDVVLCDLKMPGMTGQELYAETLTTHPEQASAFVFMTGVGFGADVERFVAESGRPLLEKPFVLADALAVMSKVFAKNLADGARSAG